MAIAQGINKLTVFKKQTGLGVPATGAGGQVMRRERSEFKLEKDTFENNEIVQHQQSTGATHGLRKVSGSLNGVVSPNTYSTVLASLLRKAFTATAPFVAGIDVTAAAVSPHFVDASGGYLSGGLKVGDVGRWTGFAGAGATNNNGKNFLITALTATQMTGMFLDGTPVAVDAAGDNVTFTVIGKKCIAPVAAHTREYWTVEEWYPDIVRSEVFTDVAMATADIGLPSTGNATFAATFVGLNRTIGAAQILTTPTAATTTSVQTAVNGAIVVNGVEIGNVTAASIKIDGTVASMGAVLGSNLAPDIQRGRIAVSGSVTAFFENGVLSTLFDDATLASLIIVVTNDVTAASEFTSYVMSAVKFSGDASDDGEKGVIKTFPFIAELNGAGGAALANDQTIISIQDSQAA
jgi:hypothetical protein